MSKAAQLSAPFTDFARTCAAVGATSKRLAKAEHVGAYLGQLSDADVAVAARFLSGTVFPQWDQRTLSVGMQTLLGALAELSGKPPDTLRSLLVSLGDLGDVAHAVLAGQAPQLTLQKLDAALAQLAALKGAAKKRTALTQLLTQCTVDEARYLVRLVTGELRIGLQEGAVEDGLARLYKRPLAAVQWTNMLLGDIGEVALLTRHNRLSEAKIRLFHPLKFMLATPAEDTAFAISHLPPSFVAEDKYDGIRAQAHVARLDDGSIRVALFSRTLDDITPSFPELVPALSQAMQKVHNQAAWIIDGEIVPMLDGATLPFSQLQKRLGRKKPDAEILRSVPVVFTAFDMLCVDATMLIEQPWQARRDILAALPLLGSHLRITESPVLHDAAGIDAAFTAARARNNEGLILKDPAAVYKPGRRGKEWLKVKRPLASLDVVVTSVEVGHGRRREWLSDYTFAVRAADDDPTLLNVGKAYSGLTDAEIATMTEWFRAHTLQEFAHGKVRVVEPRIVIEVTFDKVQPSARHKSGFALRFPRIVRLRPDKSVDDIDTLASVSALAII